MTGRDNDWLRVVYGEVVRKLDERAEQRPDSTRTPDGVARQQEDDDDAAAAAAARDA